MLLGNFAGPPVSAATGGISAVFGIVSYLSTARGQPILGAEILTKASDLRRELSIASTSRARGSRQSGSSS